MRVVGLALILCLFASPALSQQSLQHFVNQLMRGRRGAVVVSNPQTGEIRAVWNPRLAAGVAFPPGSTAKLVTAVAGLEEGAISPHDQILCRGVSEHLGGAYRCVHPQPAEPYTVASALANSCNYFFVAVSERLTADALAHWFAALGFGTAVEVPGWPAAAGRVEVKTDERSKALAALGERTIVATPLQLLLAYSAIAAGGNVYAPWRAGSLRSSPAILRQVKLHPQTLQALAAGFEECVQSGTCRAAAVRNVRVAGKTGTATALDGSGATHAWFVGFAPVDRPEIALVVFLERGTGAHHAAPLAGKILAHYFASKSRTP